MAHSFVEIAPTALGDNVFQAIGRDAMLITAGTSDRFNTMTASWGGWGHLWNRDVTFSFVRPQRHTFGFMEQAEYYTLCFFDKEHQAALDYCGSHSGRDVDKIAATGLTSGGRRDGRDLFCRGAAGPRLPQALCPGSDRR